MKTNIAVCCWEYRGSYDQKHNRWHLMESYLIDSEGKPEPHPRHPIISNSDALVGWLYRIQEASKEWESISGRAITTWSMLHGVLLDCLHPPEGVNWLDASKLPGTNNWFQIVEGGYMMLEQTAEEAARLLSINVEVP